MENRWVVGPIFQLKAYRHSLPRQSSFKIIAIAASCPYHLR
jgi:hypothetical protein